MDKLAFQSSKLPAQLEITGRYKPLHTGGATPHDWPGNVRELKNPVERSVYRTPMKESAVSNIIINPFTSSWAPIGPIVPMVSPPESSPETPTAVESGGLTFREAVAKHERALLDSALVAAAHNQTIAAQSLGLSYHQLRRQLAKHGMAPSQRREQTLSE